MRLCCALLIALACSACQAPSLSIVKNVDNKEVSVEIMATFDGIRLYRVGVGDREVYVARVVGSADVATHWMEPQGKIHVPRDLQTLVGQ